MAFSLFPGLRLIKDNWFSLIWYICVLECRFLTIVSLRKYMLNSFRHLPRKPLKRTYANAFVIFIDLSIVCFQMYYYEYLSIYEQSLTMCVLAILYTLVLGSRTFCSMLHKNLWLRHLNKCYKGLYNFAIVVLSSIIRAIHNHILTMQKINYIWKHLIDGQYMLIFTYC